MNFKRLYAVLSTWFALAVLVHAQTWTSADIGTVGLPGSMTLQDSTTYSVSGSGADIWNAADAFQFVYQTLAGDGQVTTRLVSAPKSDASAKSGVMIRESLAAIRRPRFW